MEQVLQYVLTGLAGLALGVVGMRVWQSRDAASGPSGEAPKDVAADTPPAPESATGSRKLLIGAGALAVLAAAILIFRPSGDEPAAAVAGGGPAAPGQQLDDVDTMIQRLAQRLEKEPNDGEGWRMLGWSYVMTQRPQQAIEPYKRALQLLPKSATVHAGYGEALVGVAAGKVTPEAKAKFDAALALDPAEPRARYFDALWLAQNGKPGDALDKWIALANSGPADAPWQGDVQKQIKDTAAKLGVDVSGRLKVKSAAAAPAAGVSGPTPEQMAAASAIPADQRQASVDSMVSGLAGKLAANPKNPDGWAMLLRSRMVLKQSDQAAKDLASARKALAGDAAGLATVNAAAKSAGVPGA